MHLIEYFLCVIRMSNCDDFVEAGGFRLGTRWFR